MSSTEVPICTKSSPSESTPFIHSDGFFVSCKDLLVVLVHRRAMPQGARSQHYTSSSPPAGGRAHRRNLWKCRWDPVLGPHAGSRNSLLTGRDSKSSRVPIGVGSDPRRLVNQHILKSSSTGATQASSLGCHQAHQLLTLPRQQRARDPCQRQCSARMLSAYALCADGSRLVVTSDRAEPRESDPIYSSVWVSFPSVGGVTMWSGWFVSVSVVIPNHNGKRRQLRKSVERAPPPVCHAISSLVRLWAEGSMISNL